MKGLLIAVLTAGIVTFAGGATTYAQVEGPIHVTIPFSFTVKDKAFPAGEYVLTDVNDANPQTMELRSADGKRFILFETESAVAKTEPSKPELVFDKLGDHYFLSQVFSMGDADGGQLAKSHEQRELEGKGVKVEQHRIPLLHVMKKAVKP